MVIVASFAAMRFGSKASAEDMLHRLAANPSALRAYTAEPISAIARQSATALICNSRNVFLDALICSYLLKEPDTIESERHLCAALKPYGCTNTHGRDGPRVQGFTLLKDARRVFGILPNTAPY